MSLLDYRKVRILTLAVTGFMPLFFMTLAMGGFKTTWLGGTLLGLASLIILIVISNIVLTRNAWIKAIEREGILLFNLTSTGIVPVGIARIKKNPQGQRLFAFQQGNEEVTMLYDRSVSFTLKEPLEGQYWIDGEKATGKKFVNIRLEEDSFAKSVFFTEYMQCLIFNEQTGNFITKAELGDQERDNIIQYLTLNEQRELREVKTEMHNMNRGYADKLHAVLNGMVGSNAFKIFVVIIFVCIMAVAAWYYVPGLREAITGTADKVVGPIGTGLSSSPIQR